MIIKHQQHIIIQACFALLILFCGISVLLLSRSIVAAELSSIKNKPSLLNKKTHVLMVNPSIIDDSFWQRTQLITQQAANDLGIKLTIINGDGTRFFQLKALKDYFSNPKHSTDYVILINYPGNAKVTMDFLEQMNVQVITLEQTLSDEESLIVASPGEIYKNWLGEVYFDNEKAGFLLASSLFKQQSLSNKQAVVAGISGHYGSESTLRNLGLRTAAEQYKVKLTQIVHAGWSAEDAYDKTFKLLQRYPDINVLWCASDHMALGALKAIEELGLTAGKDIFIGGFDWTSNAIRSIDENKLSASVGGHFMMGAIAIIAIYDIENNIPHLPFVNPTKNSFSLALVTKNNVKDYYHLLTGNDLNQINFKKLAKLYSREVSISTFNLLNMLNASLKDDANSSVKTALKPATSIK